MPLDTSQSRFHPITHHDSGTSCCQTGRVEGSQISPRCFRAPLPCRLMDLRNILGRRLREQRCELEGVQLPRPEDIGEWSDSEMRFLVFEQSVKGIPKPLS